MLYASSASPGPNYRQSPGIEVSGARDQTQERERAKMERRAELQREAERMREALRAKERELEEFMD